ncbi:IclR family transcriptional regulator [Variovorax sp. J31P207]|uniref:IclR family transcriptional regulator n=1 Tax=Variovorax sp. J31P207 TaxID=3053510 RepID=UPI002575C315|nr:IclR family transcriptional regulator [Variovorax sp. J31P207]MDM0071699.1 IclR family transcriptional regulator [Variovorax sp. J31P207]
MNFSETDVSIFFPAFTMIETPPAEGSADDSLVQEAPQSALARGIRILQCFTTAEYDLSGKDLVERSGLPKATAFRLIGTLRALGLVHYSERRGKYMLAPGVLSLASPLLASMTIRSIARPLMQEFADHAQGQVTLASSTDDERLVFIEAIQGRGNSVSRPELGTSVSLSKSSTGRAFLTLLPQARLAEAVREILRQHPERAEWLEQKLASTREELATLGYCRNQGELHRNTIGVAVPVQRLIDDRRFVFGCTVPAYRLLDEPTLLSDLGMRLATLVDAVQTALGNPRR